MSEFVQFGEEDMALYGASLRLLARAYDRRHLDGTAERIGRGYVSLTELLAVEAVFEALQSLSATGTQEDERPFTEFDQFEPGDGSFTLIGEGE